MPLRGAVRCIAWSDDLCAIKLEHLLDNEATVAMLSTGPKIEIHVHSKMTAALSAFNRSIVTHDGGQWKRKSQACSQFS